MEALDFTRGTLGADGLSYVITLVVVVTVIIAVSYVLKYLQPLPGKEVELVSSPFNAANNGQTKTIEALPTGQPYTIGFWIFVNDWNYRWNEPKQILNVPGQEAQTASAGFAEFQANSKFSNPLVMLYPQTNKMAIRIRTKDLSPETSNEGDVMPWTAGTGTGADWKKSNYFESSKTCDIDNIPLNRWISVVIVYTGVSMDIYRDGHLYRSCVLDNVSVNTLEKMELVNDGVSGSGNSGFKGRMGRTFRAARAFKANDVLAWHNRGPGGERSEGLLAFLGIDRLLASQTDLDGNTQSVEGNF